MINRQQLLKDLQRELPKLEKDILAYSEQSAERTAHLKQEYAKAKDAGRTAEHFVSWREAQITQAAVAWVLTCVFVRFLEDNGLLAQPVLAGPVERETGQNPVKTHPLKNAKDRIEAYFNEYPTHAEREYLLHLFEQLEQIPVIAELLDHHHNPLWQIPVSADGAKSLIDFFQKIDPETGEIIHDFTDPDWDTRFLGDLYQDLSEAVRKRYALLQTPEFVESFILDYTLEPAIKTFGLEGLRLIDPTCGSGHFLLTTFERIFERWQKREPATNSRVLAQRALDLVHGVDINPYAIAICRFRLLMAAMKVCDIELIKDAPAFQFNLACGDSLLHGRRFEWQGQGIQNSLLEPNPIDHVLEVEDKERLSNILGKQYHAVVGNPPYIIVKDAASRQSIRIRYPESCFGKYGMGAPFTERFFDLSLSGENAGYVGIITTNAFMKRDWGERLITVYLPKKDLTHILDTSGAYIPGHGTPTVIMFGRNRKPLTENIKVSLGIRGEPEKPKKVAEGIVWKSIVGNIKHQSFENDFVTIADYPRALYSTYPWSLIGGGAIELKEIISKKTSLALDDLAVSIGPASFPGIDEVYIAEHSCLKRRNIDDKYIRPFVSGECVREWASRPALSAFTPYDEEQNIVLLGDEDPSFRFVWAYRRVLESIVSFGGKNRKEIGQIWYSWYRWIRSRFLEKNRICFPSMGTHNHFTIVSSDFVFNRHAPLIVLDVETDDDFFAALGYLNSSVACFFLKQFCFNKGDSTDSEGARTTGDPEFDTYEFSAKHVSKLPMFISKKVATYSRKISLFAEQLRELEVEYAISNNSSLEARVKNLKGEIILLQEKIDWEVYSCCDLIESQPSNLSDAKSLSVRAFELILTEKIKQGLASDAWFERHNRKIPDEHDKKLKPQLDIIRSNRFLRFLESPMYKRRWVDDGFNKQALDRIRENCLLDIIENKVSKHSTLITCAILVDELRVESRFLEISALYVGQLDFDVQALVVDLVGKTNVPEVSAVRLKPFAVEKYRAWQETWEKQRQEDSIDAEYGVDKPLTDADGADEDERTKYEEAKRKAEAKKAKMVGDIPVPPQYKSSDFRKASYWQLRGKLDVPKERFFSLPGSEKDGDNTLVIGWAGLNHLQRAQAIAAWYEDRKENDGWEAERLMPMLVAIDELIPWLKQWHNDIDPEYGERMGDFYESYLLEELRRWELTRGELLAWRPPVATRRRRV